MADSDINAVVLDESTSISLPAAGQRKTFTMPALPPPTGYRVERVVVSARSPRKV